MSKWDKYKIDSVKNPANKWDKYKIKKEPPQSNLEVAAKGLANGAISLADIPQNIASLLGNYNPRIALAGGIVTPFMGEYEQYEAPPAVASTAIKKGIKNLTGTDLEPRPSNSTQRLLSHAGEFAGSMAPFGLAAKGAGLLGKFKNVAKLATTGATTGAASSVLQEGGVNPLAADISASLGMPLAGATGKNLLNRFSNLSSRGYENTIKRKTGEILKEKIREKNMPKVLAKLDNKLPFGIEATTAELAENPGLARLHQTLAPNISEIAEKQATGDSAIRKQLRALSPATELSSEKVGSIVQKNLADNLDNYLKIRAKGSEPLYKAVENLKTGVPLNPFNEFLVNESRFAKGSNKKTLDYLKDLVGQGSKNLKSDSFSIGGSKLKLDQLPVGAQFQLQNKLSGASLPGDLMGAVKDINNRLGKAVKDGRKEEARLLQLGKDSLLESMANIPEEQLARSTYANLSKNVNTIEKEPLLKKFIKKDSDKAFVLSPEQVPDLILKGSLNNVRALIKQVGNNKNTMDAIRGSVVKKILGSTELSSINAAKEGNLSYDKFNNFLKNNREKLNLIFEKEQVKVLDDINEILKRRSMVSTLSRAAGSPTQSNLTLLDSLTAPVNSVTKKVLSSLPGSKYVMMAGEAAKNYEQGHINRLLEKALVDPEVAKLLLTPVKDIKNQNILKRIYTPQLAIPVFNNKREEK